MNASRDRAGQNKAPPRRSYKKSRNGCDQCKERHVKCDEARPKCSNCIHRELHCTFLKVPPTGNSTFGSPPQLAALDDVRSQRQMPFIEYSSSELRYSVRDLELMHLFSIDSYKSRCGNQSDVQAWQCLIPRHTYSNEYLLHGILALAALHMAAKTSTTPDKARLYLGIAVRYGGLSFSAFREALDQLTPQTCEAVFACSAVVMVISIALPCLSAEYHNEKLILLETMTTAWELFQGGRKISYISEPWLRNSIFSDYNSGGMPTAVLDQETSDALNQLEQLNSITTDCHSETWEINRQTIELLKSCFSRFAYGSHPAAILGWLAYVRKEFVDQVVSRQPFQLLILMYWGVLLNELGCQFWWARGSGKALVAEISVKLKCMTGDLRWESALRWPRQKVHQERSLSPGA